MPIIKHSLLRIIVLFSAFLYSQTIFSFTNTQTSITGQQDLTIDDIKRIKELLLQQATHPYAVNVYGLLQGNANFIDTDRNNTPDFSVRRARLGVFAVERNWSGKLEVEFYGNQPKALFPAGNPLYLSQSGNNTVSLRQAQINFNFFNTEIEVPKDVILIKNDNASSVTSPQDKPNIPPPKQDDKIKEDDKPKKDKKENKDNSENESYEDEYEIYEYDDEDEEIVEENLAYQSNKKSALKKKRNNKKISKDNA